MKTHFVLPLVVLSSIYNASGEEKGTPEPGLFTYVLDGDIAKAKDILPQSVVGHTIIAGNRISLSHHKNTAKNPGYFPERVTYHAHAEVYFDEPGGYVFAVRSFSPPLTYNCNCAEAYSPNKPVSTRHNVYRWGKPPRNRNIVQEAFLDCSFEITFVDHETEKTQPILAMETSGRFGSRYAIDNLKKETAKEAQCATVDEVSRYYELAQGQYHIDYHISCPGFRQFKNPTEQFNQSPYTDSCGQPVGPESFDDWPGDEVSWELYLLRPGSLVPEPFAPQKHFRIKEWD